MTLWAIFETLHFFFITYKWVQQAGAFYYTSQARLTSDKLSNLLGPFIHCEEMKCENDSLGCFHKTSFSLLLTNGSNYLEP